MKAKKVLETIRALRELEERGAERRRLDQLGSHEPSEPEHIEASTIVENEPSEKEANP